MLKSLSAALLLVAAPMAMAAPGVSIDAGVSAASLALSGSAGAGSGAHVTDLRSGLGYSRATQKSAWFAIEHALSGWPNLRLSHAVWDESAVRTQAPAGPMAPPLVARSALGIDSSDVVLYWSPVTLPFQLDLGVDLHRLDVDFVIDVAAVDGHAVQSVHESATQWFPAAYGAARVDLPLTGLYASGSLVASRYDDRELVEAFAGVGWSPLPVVSVQAGYRQQKLKFHSDAIRIDMRTKGPFVALRVRL